MSERERERQDKTRQQFISVGHRPLEKGNIVHYSSDKHDVHGETSYTTVQTSMMCMGKHRILQFRQA